MAIRRTLAQFSDEIVAADLADNSVTTAKIADSQITAAKVAADVATQAELNVVSTAVDNVDTSTAMKPHIRTDVLYPAVANIMVDGSTALSAVTTGPNSSTVASSKYGTVQSDGRMYYYTDIKGSKPIKDPRIGAHFGSQRHRCSSLQLLEQETATHGSNVYSMDGREWARCVGDNWTIRNDKNAIGAPYLANCNNANNYIEVTGYFSQANMSSFTNHDFPNNIDVLIDGTDTGTQLSFETTVQTSLYNRFVDATSLKEVPVGSTTLGIHTLRLTIADPSAFYFFFCKFELIAQDTTSTTTKSQIQIPSQNVVSYGKKFTVAETKHYNPFAFKTDGTTAWASGAHNGTAWPVGTGSSTNIDTATSLGLDAWVSTNYYYPYNGGRVVKWIASDGTIKTSVNMMPPNARSKGNSSSLTNATAKANASIANNTFFPTMEAGAIDHSQAEAAKTFHYREFGNGAANGGTGSGSYADPSMLNSSDDVAYVMDDGLTSLSCNDVMNITTSNDNGASCLRTDNGDAGDGWYITWIGTGIYFSGNPNMATSGYHRTTWAQNLPYGTHILTVMRTGTSHQHEIKVDGILVYTATSPNDYYAGMDWVTFYQPKMPPIPENACIIADYMLMADHVPVSGSGLNLSMILSKGTRYVDSSRDFFYNSGAAWANMATYMGWYVGGFRAETTHANAVARLPFFGTNSIECGYSGRISSYLNGNASTNQTTVTSSETWATSITHDGATLGSNFIEVQDGTNSNFNLNMCYVVSPIHTSSHYQTFETPWLHELVGGDRNMEQTNLVVTSDGKTWDEVTRDTSYIGNLCLQSSTDAGAVSANVTVIMDEWRGKQSVNRTSSNKYFAIAYDRVICLVDGQYQIQVQTIARASGTAENSAKIYINGTNAIYGHTSGSNHSAATSILPIPLKRGDYVQIKGGWYASHGYSNFSIIKIK